MHRLLAANNLHSRGAFITLISSAILFSQTKDSVQGVHSGWKSWKMSLFQHLAGKVGNHRFLPALAGKAGNLF